MIWNNNFFLFVEVHMNFPYEKPITWCNCDSPFVQCHGCERQHLLRWSDERGNGKPSQPPIILLTIQCMQSQPALHMPLVPSLGPLLPNGHPFPKDAWPKAQQRSDKIKKEEERNPITLTKTLYWGHKSDYSSFYLHFQ